MHYGGERMKKQRGKVMRDLGGSVYLLTLPYASDATLPSVDFQRECSFIRSIFLGNLSIFILFCHHHLI